MYQASCFGWVVDATSGQAIAFGGDPLYVAMRDANPSHLKNQSIDYGAMFHTQLMLKKQGGVGLDPAKQALVNRYTDNATDKVVLRGILKDVLLQSLRESHIHDCYSSLSSGIVQVKFILTRTLSR